MTTGSTLKNKLGLSKLKYVAIARALYSNIRLYFVFFDTRHPNSPLTTPIMFRKPMPSSISQSPFNSRDNFGPWMAIEDFNGQVETGIFISIDLSGRMGNDSLREDTIENFNFIYAKNLNTLQEITLPDFKQNAVSSLNKKYLKLRQSEGDPIINMKDVLWNENDDTITLFFDAHPTYDKEVTNYSPELKPYRDNKYILMVQFLEVSKIIGDKATFKEFSSSEQGKLVLQMIKEADVKLWSSDPSFLWQGAWEYLDQVDSSIFKYKGPAGKDIWSKRHSGTKIEGLHCTKHLAEVFSLIFTNYLLITSFLRRE